MHTQTDSGSQMHHPVSRRHQHDCYAPTQTLQSISYMLSYKGTSIIAMHTHTGVAVYMPYVCIKGPSITAMPTPTNIAVTIWHLLIQQTPTPLLTITAIRYCGTPHHVQQPRSVHPYAPIHACHISLHCLYMYAKQMTLQQVCQQAHKPYAAMTMTMTWPSWHTGEESKVGLPATR